MERSIMDLSKAILCARMSKLAYSNNVDKIKTIFKKMGFNHVKFFSRNGSQAYVVHNEREIYVIYRGTELNEIKDLLADSMMWPTDGQKQGKVHSGFARATSQIWPQVNAYIKAEIEMYGMHNNLCFTGHSMGGAMAIISAARTDIVGVVYAFGAPRTGNKKYAMGIKSKIYRIHNENDIIPAILPPIGYRHGGTQYHLFKNQLFYSKGLWSGIKLRFRIAIYKLVRFEFIQSLIRDHYIANYVKHLRALESKMLGN